MKKIFKIVLLSIFALPLFTACETDDDNACKINAIGPRNLSIAAKDVGAKMVQ